MALADRIAVFNNGRLQQVGTPIEIYTEPKTEFVANFIGESTVLTGIGQNGNFVGNGLRIFDIPLEFVDPGNVKLIIRPEAFSIGRGVNKCASARLKEIIFAGDALEVLLTSSTGLDIKVKSEVSLLPQLLIGEMIDLYVDPSQIGQVG
jgi:ABC-type Fe3+/spermidine/putrescine transport system ATPase subunit